MKKLYQYKLLITRVFTHEIISLLLIDKLIKYRLCNMMHFLF